MRTLPRGELVEVGGRRIALYRAGAGGPPVVLLPGAGLIGLEYDNLLQGAAELTTAVTYDRAGTGWSDPVTLPRSAAEVAEELRCTLAAAGIPGPYVLAGHSLGAVYARRFAQLHPADVAGLLFIDPGHEDILRFLPPAVVALNEQLKPTWDALPDLTPEQLDASRQALSQLYSQWPDDIRSPLVEHRLEHWRTGIAEGRNLEGEVYAELAAAGPLPDVPLIVLTAADKNPFWVQHMPADLLEPAHAGIHALHAAIAASVPRGEQRLIAGASHQYLHVQQPAPVLAALRDLLDRVRDRGGR
ncbi:alpha/beta fold hydrolase [Dactylosporangium matsuzakiense]|uniref:alpha/beta fold hydrolase n=1 Tax=Dactylosporangium matsuzakiense TaxID=53360 RepID=UPI0021C29FFD|nr:alpha/beta hydrolase [Dactylosporangium matsuzakiense]UWZ41770.1 alpha/beta hydrolase [Dactylosporangium matsuzakiense]